MEKGLVAREMISEGFVATTGHEGWVGRRQGLRPKQDKQLGWKVRGRTEHRRPAGKFKVGLHRAEEHY